MNECFVWMRSLKIAHECLKHKVQAVSVLWNRRGAAKRVRERKERNQIKDAEVSTLHSRNSWIPEESLAQGRAGFGCQVFLLFEKY